MFISETSQEMQRQTRLHLHIRVKAKKGGCDYVAAVSSFI